jgi:nicotinamidase/pyrazinamidase
VDVAESDRALLVVDMTVDHVQGPHAVPGALALVRFIQGELRYFRERGRPVIFACTAADLESPPQVIQELTPRTDERVIYKPHPSAFDDTDLLEILEKAQVRRLTLVGVESATSILLTAADAMAKGVHVVVPDPCVASRDDDEHRLALRLIREVWPPLFAGGGSLIAATPAGGARA